MTIKERLTTKKAAVWYFVMLVLAYLFLLYLPAEHFDTGTPMCLSVLVFDRECYACGMTRGIQHLIHFDFEGAWNFNKLCFLVFPLAIAMISIELYKMYKGIKRVK